MVETPKLVFCAAVLAATLATLATPARSATGAPPGALPGDEALTCEQIYAQGAAESGREQQERARRGDERKHQAVALQGLIVGATLAPNPAAQVALGKAANSAAENVAARAVADGAAVAPVNARKERLRELWTRKHCAAGGHSPAAPAGDRAMGCAEIAAELAPYGQALQPNLHALGVSQQQQFERSMQRSEQRKKERVAVEAMAAAAAIDPTGLSKRAYQAAEMAQTAKERAEDKAELDTPLARQAQAERQELAAQAQALQGNARVTQLMEMAQRQGCTNK